MKKATFLGVQDQFLSVLDSLEYGDEFFVSRSGRGIFTPALTMWLMICQKLKGGEGLIGAINEIVSGGVSRISERNVKSKRFRVGEVSCNSGGYSRARSRLHTSHVREVTEAIAEQLIGNQKDKWEWNGKKVYLFDGTTIRIDRSEENRKRFPANKNQYGEAKTPLLLCACTHELFSGTALSPCFGAYRGNKATSEQRLYIEMLANIPVGSLIIADRNLGVFPMAHQAHAKGVEVLLRLTSRRAKAFEKNEDTKTNIDKSVEWSFRSTAVPDLDIAENATVSGRFIRHTIHRKGHKPLKLLFFTTSTEPANKLVALYKKREKVENDIRSLKYALGMEMLSSKTPDMIEKEVLLGIAAYNLARAVISRAARTLKIKPRDISFSGALHMIAAFGQKLSYCSDPKEQKIIQDSFIKAIGQQKLPKRKHPRMEARKIVHQRQRFPRLKKSRKEERKQIKTTLAEYGHRGYFSSVTRNS